MSLHNNEERSRELIEIANSKPVDYSWAKWVGAVILFIVLVVAGNHMLSSNDNNAACQAKYPVNNSMSEYDKQSQWFMQDLCQKGKA